MCSHSRTQTNMCLKHSNAFISETIFQTGENMEDKLYLSVDIYITKHLINLVYFFLGTKHPTDHVGICLVHIVATEIFLKKILKSLQVNGQQWLAFSPERWSAENELMNSLIIC